MSCSITPAKATSSALRSRFAASTTPPIIASRKTGGAISISLAAIIRSNLDHPRVLQMVMDSLRYWVEDMQVDGFRFDLAADALRAKRRHFSRRSRFLAAIAQDPVLSQSKLIAEPWDLGPDGYQLGGFRPAGGMER